MNSEKQTDFSKEVQDIQSHTSSYAHNREFRAYWLGFTEEARNSRAQTWRVFGELLSAVTPSLTGWHILDVGCGDGRNLRAMLEYDARPGDLVGIDVSDARFPIGLRINPLVTLKKTNGVTLPFCDNSFDLVTQFVCFSNIPTTALRRQVAVEIQRVLKPGGYVFWWDLPQTTAPSDSNVNIEVADYFDWPMRKVRLGLMPKPSECLCWPRPRGVGFLVKKLVDRFSYSPTYCAALIGPKP